MPAYLSESSEDDAHVAPLHSHSHSTQSSTDMSQASSSFSQKIESSAAMSNFTPPATPDDDDVQLSSFQYPQPVFHHFLRTIYPFHSESDSSIDETVTLPLNQGDVIMVHSIHTNGWADGTLLLNGARGWLPTNYCESYDEEYMRGLLAALMKFWGILQSGVTIDDRIFDGQGFMQGIVAGVRYLLERSNCLRRESPMILGNDALRRNRKALLAELSSLVKTGKALEAQRQNTFTRDTQPLDNLIIDEMLLKAFKIVTRGVKFLDAFLNDPRSEQITKRYMPTVLAEEQVYDPSTPPAEVTAFENAQNGCNAASRRLSTRSYTSATPTAQPMDQQTRRLSYRPASHVHSSSLNSNSPGMRHSALHLRRSCLSPDTTCARPEVDRTNFVSERLTSAQGSLNSCLGALIGRLNNNNSPHDLFANLREVIIAGKALSVVVEALCAQDMQPDCTLIQVREAMYECVNKLITAARECVRNGNEDDMTADPRESIRQVATDFIVVTGECSYEASSLIDMIGDFEIEPAGLGIDPSTFGNDDDTLVGSIRNLSISAPEQPAARAPSPSLVAVQEEKPLPMVPEVIEQVATVKFARVEAGMSMAEFLSSPMQSPSMQATPTQESVTAAAAQVSPVTEQAYKFAKEHNIVQVRSFGERFDLPNDAAEEEVRSTSRQQSHSSNMTTSTYLSRMRDSEISVVSQTSTRATTPDLVPYGAGHNSSKSSSVNSLAPSHHTVADEIDEAECSVLVPTFAHELIFSQDGTINAGSLPALIERLTIHDAKPDTQLVSAFYLTFRLFTTAEDFAQALVDRFDYVEENPFVAGAVRLRVYNVFKGWVESHWSNSKDMNALPIIRSFAQGKLLRFKEPLGRRLLELAEKATSADGPLVPRLVSSMGKTSTAVAQYVAADAPCPPSVLTKKEINLLKTWRAGGDINSPSILDLSPLELARQFTLKEMNIYNNIQPEELLHCEWEKDQGSIAFNVKAMSTLSNGLVDLVKESILSKDESDPKRRAAMIKQWIKIAMECRKLNNYNCLAAIQGALATSAIVRLGKTWSLVSEKRKQQLAEINQIFSSSKNHKNLRETLKEDIPPCIPYLGLYQMDLHMIHKGSKDTRKMSGSDKQLIYFDKHMRTAAIIGEVQRFQIPYRLTEIPDLQAWIQTQIVRVRAVNDGMNESQVETKYHNRSLITEPKFVPVEPYANASMNSDGSAPTSATTQKDKFDIFTWSHATKERLNFINNNNNNNTNNTNTDS